jgi:hypothetical protein
MGSFVCLTAFLPPTLGLGGGGVHTIEEQLVVPSVKLIIHHSVDAPSPRPSPTRGEGDYLGRLSVNLNFIVVA